MLNIYVMLFECYSVCDDWLDTTRDSFLSFRKYVYKKNGKFKIIKSLNFSKTLGTKNRYKIHVKIIVTKMQNGSRDSK